MPSGGHCYKLQPQHLSTSAVSRQPVSARTASMGEAVITVGRGSKGLLLGLVPSTLAHAAPLLLSTMLKAGYIPARPGGTSGASKAGGDTSAFPHCRLMPATNLGLGSLDCCCLIYCMLKDVRKGSAFSQAHSWLSLAPVQHLQYRGQAVS